jgi:DNA topoisomerase 2-associated protein PAT1
MMTADEIDFILRIQYAATHSGSAYIEDYYHQAYIHKFFRGRNARGRFAPDVIRNVDGSEADIHSAQTSVTVDVGALGRLVLSNIRTPKPLMDLRSGPAVGAGKGTQGGSTDEESGAAVQRPLDQEPLLAARVMIEDCMNLIMDVDDVDRLLALESATSANSANLHARRAVLLDGIASAFQLPQDALGQAVDAARGDAVFLQVLALPKGRTLLAKTLLLMFTGLAAASEQKRQQQLQNGSSRDGNISLPGLPLVWALLRNAHALFGFGIDAAAAGKAEKRLVDSTSQLAAAAAEVVKRLQQPMEAIECLAALNASVDKAANVAGEGGDGGLPLLPLFPAQVAAAEGNPDWLGTVLAALLLRASELGLGSFARQGTVVSLGKGQEDEDELMAAADEGSAGQRYDPLWQEQLVALFEAVLKHLAAVYSIVKGGNMVWGPAGKEAAKKLSGVPVVRGMIAHCSSEQQEQLRTYLSELSH